jgi:cephalosporin-C deacetylase-like acetyl esterase
VPEGATNGRPLIFGHGLFGTADAVLPLAPLAAAGNFVACATDWSGMSSEDVPNALALSEDLSRFPTLTDRTQQGFLNFLFLGRLMIHPQGLASNSEFTGKIDRRRLFYAGASQGGILGGALTAIAPDPERSALIVPAMNFSLLLTRSTQFTPFRDVLYDS